MPSRPAAPPTTSGVSAEDFIADPVKAVAALKVELRKEVRQEIIGANILFLALYHFIVRGDR